MQLEDYFDFLEPDVIRIKGHRIGIEHVVDYYLNGLNADEIAKEFPGLSLEKIYATLTYYHHNQPEVHAYMKRLDDWAEQEYQKSLANPSPVARRLRELKAQRSQQSA